jgi:hypothetical protein
VWVSALPFKFASNAGTCTLTHSRTCQAPPTRGPSLILHGSSQAAAAAAAATVAAMDVSAAEAEKASFTDCNELQSLGINVADIQKLKQGCVHTAT